jgi:class 3 adenylate cyclase/tetratricopeptide (TPR) repeat protein
MKCPRCQHENPSEAKFCLECGARLAHRCSQCGTELPARAKFCLECGQAVSGPTAAQDRFSSPESYTPKHLAEKILTSKSALEGERKQVTVLFADLKGSMELLADRDPEEARKILDPVLERMMEAVHRYEGTVNQVMGDGIMALFGAPLAHEDHAVRACYAALRMQDVVRRYSDDLRRAQGVEVQIRIGLNSGEVVVRSVGSDLRMDYTAVGQTTHLAARMEQLATPGTIRLTANTLGLAEGYVAVKPLGRIPVKGLAEPPEAYELTGAGPARTRLEASRTRGFTRFVGRDAEMDQLRSAAEEIRRGRGQLVAVVGEPGVGKSRLYYEFIHSHHTHGWLTLESGSVSYGKAAAYLPLTHLLRSYFRIERRDDVRAIRAKVTGHLLTLDEALKQAIAPVLWLLDALPEDSSFLALDPADRRRRTLAVIKSVLLRESQIQPLLVVFEDLHWIDSETQTFLDGLIESLPVAPILLAVNYRPEYQHVWGSKTYYRQLRIDALPPQSAEELLGSLVGQDASLNALKPLLIARTEGNPLFLEESVRTLVEVGGFAGGRGAYRLVKPLDTISVPPTVQAMLAARIDRLGVEDKRLLQAAAAVGKDVPFALLLAVADLDEDRLRGGLTRLQATEFLYEARLFPELEYTFKHALTHEVAYGSLLHDRRRQLHAAIVKAMEDHYAGRVTEHTERLAHHAVCGEAWEKAVTYLWQAGRNARGRSAYRQAAAFLERAEEALKRLPQTAERTALGIDLLCRDLSDALSMLGQHQRIIEYLHEAACRAESVGDRARLAEVLARTLRPLRILGRYDQGVEIGEKALAIAKGLGDARLNAIAGMELGWLHWRGGHMHQAETLLRQVLGGLESSADVVDAPDIEWIRRFTLGGLVEVLISVGRYREAIGLGEEALRMAETLGHPAPIAGALFRLGKAYGGLGDLAKAIDLCARSVALGRERDALSTIQLASAYLGEAYTLAGRADEAVARLEEAVAYGESMNAVDAFTLVSLGHAYLAAGRREDASRCARDALAMPYQGPGLEATALYLLGDIAAHRDPPVPEEATQRYRQALALAQEHGMRPLLAHCHLGLGKLSRATGKREQAQGHLTTATTMYREMEMTYWLEKAEAELQAFS